MVGNWTDKYLIGQWYPQPFLNIDMFEYHIQINIVYNRTDKWPMDHQAELLNHIDQCRYHRYI